jgi:putative ATP-binding cassette transporter
MPTSAGGDETSSARLGAEIMNLLRGLRRPRLPRLNGIPGLSIVSPLHLFLVAASSALCGTGVIMVLNAEARLLQGNSYSIALAAGFIILLILYRETQKLLIKKSVRALEGALHEQRVRIAEALLKLDLNDIEELPQATIVDGLSIQHQALSQTIVPLIIGFQSLILLIFMTIYLFSQSVGAGLLTVIFAALIVQGYLSKATELQDTMTAAATADAALRRTSEEIGRGFKELRLNTAKIAAFETELKAQSEAVAEHRAGNAHIIGALVTTGNSAAYMLGAAVVFLLPVLTGAHGPDLLRIVTTVLFLLGPLGGVVGAIQQLSAAQFSLSTADAFEKRLVESAVSSIQTATSSVPAFESLELAGISYRHKRDHGEAAFAIRDIGFELRRGEVIFITGGNGSGKTTMLRVLTGLYHAESGAIRLNGAELAKDRLDEYRQLFTTVFSDFHIFQKPYGLDTDGIGRLRANLDDFDLGMKFPDEDFVSGYDPLALSSGQRKRLALALAMAERRPVMVLDEWAADQDPMSRDRFYRALLPKLRATGLAIVVVTHDDRYFDLADKRYHMEDGQLRLVAPTS